MKAWTTVGSVWPTLSVPGMMRSGTILDSRNTAVVVANDPIPRASKKFVTAPSAIWTGFGKPTSVAWTASALALRPAPRTALNQPTM